MRPVIRYERGITERAIEAAHPLWALLAKIAPGVFGEPEGRVPHPSSMLASPNILWRILLPRFFKRVSVDASEAGALIEASRNATVVYIAKYMGQLEYSFFNRFLTERSLPLAEYNNALALRRWMKPRDLVRSVSAQQAQLGKHGRILEPLYDGYLPQMIAAGTGVLIRIPPADLLDEDLPLTGPLRSLIAVIESQRAGKKPVAIVPVDFLWSRRPPKARRGMGEILLGDQGSPGCVRKFFLFWRNYRRRAHASIGRPIMMQDFLSANADAADDEELARRLREELLGALKTQRRSITGPPMRPRSWYIQQVMSDESLERRVLGIAADRGKGAGDLMELAHRYAREIVSDLDYTYVELFERLLGRVFSRLFNSLDVDEDGLARAKSALAEGPLVFVPNHKSHVDYLILSYILHNRGMPLPHIAAGTNLSFWPLGRIFRRCGAYFIRRAFRDNPLYKAVLETYIKYMLKEGLCQEFFIEGGRSRTGKLKNPKMGMMGMVKRAAREAGVDGASFVPVSITYDRVIEQRSYVKELEGGGKKRESTRDLFGLTRFLGKNRTGYGSIYVRFGRPMPLLGATDELRDVARDAWSICREINRGVVVTPASVAAAAILSVSRRGLTFSQFRRNYRAVIECLRAKGARIPDALADSTDAVMQDAVASLERERLITARPEALEPFIAVEDAKRVPLAYFRNSIVHFLVTLGVVSRLLMWHAAREETPDTESLAGGLASAKALLHHEFRFAASMKEIEHARAAVKILESGSAVSASEDGRIVPRNSGLWLLELLSAQIRPFVESLWVAARYVEERVREPIEERALTAAMLTAGEDMYQLGRVSFRESITREGFANALAALVNFRILSHLPQQQGAKRRRTLVPTGDTQSMERLKAELEKLC